MTIHFGNVPVDSTLYIPFTTYNSSGASVTLTGLAVTDIEIYKDGSTTQRASDAGYALLDTDGIDFDGVTGLHGFSIDLSDNTTAGFYAAGSQYWVVVSTVTIDSQTVTLLAATFRIGPAEANTTQIAGSTVSTTSAQIGVNVVNAAGTAWNSGAIGAATLAADTLTAAKVASDVGTEIATAVWASGTRTLSALDEDNTTLDLDATIRAAVGLASADLDTQLAALPTAAENADAVWDEDATGHQTGGTFGQAIGDPGADTDTIWGLVNTNLNATVSSRATQTSVDTIDDFLDTEIAAIKAKTDQLTFSTANRVDAQVFGMESGVVTATAIAADAIGASELAADAVAEIADAVWDEARSGHTTEGSFGEGVTSVQGDVTGNVDGSVASVTGAVGSVTGNVGGNVTGSVGSLAAQAKADVNAEVVDGLATDTYAEPGQGAPAATTTLAAKIGYLYKAWRNKSTQTEDTYSLFADDATTVDQKSTVSDDGTTATKGEVTTGA